MDGIAISLRGLRKTYRIWDAPHHRLTGGLAESMSTSTLPGWWRAGCRRHFQKVCHEVHALAPLTLEVRRGEALGIVGRNGSGKSTLLQLIAGTLQPTAGEVRVYGQVAALLELGSGFNPDFSGRENVFLNATLLGLSHQEIEAKFEQIADFADIGDFIEQPVKTYSSGMLMRLAFAVQTAVDPEILIVDEALAVGDEVFSRKCFARMESIRARGCTVLFVSHDAASVVNLCTRALFLHQGECLLDGSPKYVVSRYQRFCHAPAVETAQVLAGIRREMIESPQPQAVIEIAPKGPAQEGTFAATSPSATAEAVLPESYDPHLRPSTTVSYDQYGARIGAVGLYTDDGRQVNQLHPRAFYNYRYEVEFTEDCREVAFAMLIKTLKGQEIGGSVTRSGEWPLIRAGTRFQVNFRFQCLLAPWVYFMNCGVEALLGDKRSYAHRLVDACVFRVVPTGPVQTTALVDFLVESRAEMR